MEACEWLPPALAGRDSDVPAQDPYGLLPVGSRDRLPGNRGIDSRRRAQPHGGTRTPAVRPHRLRSKTQRSLCIYARFMQQRPVEVALRRFRRAIERTGLIPELRARTAYEKPTAERKRKKAAAVARLRKQIKRSLPPKKRY